LIEVHLYGHLRRAGAQANVHRPSIAWVDIQEGTVAQVLETLGIGRAEVSNIFINGRYTPAALDQIVRSGDRLGIFPANMRMLYV
jgi:sulfur carrier protein ThiS